MGGECTAFFQQMAGERLEIVHVWAEDEGFAGEDGLGGILAAVGEKGFPDDDRVRVGGPGGELTGGVDDEGLRGGGSGL